MYNVVVYILARIQRICRLLYQRIFLILQRERTYIDIHSMYRKLHLYTGKLFYTILYTFICNMKFVLYCQYTFYSQLHTCFATYLSLCQWKRFDRKEINNIKSSCRKWENTKCVNANTFYESCKQIDSCSLNK